MKANGVDNIVIHAPYIINLANTVKPEIFELAVEFLAVEIERTAAMRSNILVLHPGSDVGAGVDAGIAQIIKGLNEVLTKDTVPYIALETMAGKGSEVGRTFEDIARIYDGVKYNDKLRVCFDTCHTHDAGYDVKNNFDKVIDEFDRIIGKDQIAVFHLNDSKNPFESHKDRHEKIGEGSLGETTFSRIINHDKLRNLPFFLETPNEIDGYKYEIELLKGLYNEQ